MSHSTCNVCPFKARCTYMYVHVNVSMYMYTCTEGYYDIYVYMHVHVHVDIPYYMYVIIRCIVVVHVHVYIWSIGTPVLLVVRSVAQVSVCRPLCLYKYNMCMYDIPTSVLEELVWSGQQRNADTQYVIWWPIIAYKNTKPAASAETTCWDFPRCSHKATGMMFITRLIA